MRKLFFTILVLLFLCTHVLAQESVLPDTDDLAQSLPKEAAELMDETSPTQQLDLWSQVKRIVRTALAGGVDPRESLRVCVILLAVAMLCALTRLISDNAADSAVACAGALGLCTAFLFGFRSMMQIAVQALEQMTDYTGCLMPILAGTASIQGAVGASTALYGGTMLFSQLLMRLITTLLIPGTYFFIAVATAEAALQNETLSELRELLGWLISKSLRIILYVFTAYMTLTGVVKGAADATAVRAAKAALSGMVPVVGGILSDASETLLAGAGMLKSTVGVFGMLAVLSICITPFLRVGLQYLLLKLTAAVSGTVGLRTHVALIKHFSTALGFLLGMCGVCAMLSLISVICFLKVVV